MSCLSQKHKQKSKPAAERSDVITPVVFQGLVFYHFPNLADDIQKAVFFISVGLNSQVTSPLLLSHLKHAISASLHTSESRLPFSFHNTWSYFPTGLSWSTSYVFPEPNRDICWPHSWKIYFLGTTSLCLSTNNVFIPVLWLSLCWGKQNMRKVFVYKHRQKDIALRLV